MSALLRKELRQVLPAQLFLTVLFAAAGYVTLDPNEVLAPFHEEQGWLHAIVAAVCFAEGLVLAYGQFASERWQGTEEYLLHRSTGRAGAFHAKCLAGLISLAMLVVLPAATFGVIHLQRHPYAGSASVLRLLLIAMAGSTAFVGYGVGALATNLGTSLLRRVGLALAVSATVFLAAFLAVMPWTFGPLPMAGRFATLVAVASAALLWAARHVFAGRVEGTPRGARVANLGLAVVVATACLPPLILAPYVGLALAITRFESDAPEIVVDEQGELYVATPTGRDRRAIWESNRDLPSHGEVYEIVDLDGQHVPEEQALHYAGWWSSSTPFEMVFDDSYMRYQALGSDARTVDLPDSTLPFGLTGAWISRGVSWHTWCFERSSGAHWVSSRESTFAPRLSGAPRPHWEQLEERTPGLRKVRGGTQTGASSVVLLDEERGRFLRVRLSKDTGLIELVDAPLPDGDRFVELGTLYGVKPARLGLSMGRRVLVVGRRDHYVWNGRGWLPWSEVEDSQRMGMATLAEAARLQRWSLEAAPTGGLGYSVSLSDPATGERLLDLDVAARTPTQHASEAVATLSCLAMPPVAAVRSYLLPLREPRSKLTLGVGTAEVDPLRGQRRTWIVVALLVFTAWLVRDLGRRLASRGTPTERRLLWCLLTAALGAPAYVLARAVESSRSSARRRTSSARREQPQLVIRTA